jgi:RHS repeat-associated protein
LSERIKRDGSLNVLSWLRYEYEGLELLRIDERYDGDDAGTAIGDDDPWRPMNVYVHGPGMINNLLRGRWYHYTEDDTHRCAQGDYYYAYDDHGNVLGVFDESGNFYRWEMDAWGNDLPGGNSFLAMDQEGPKEHITGKMYDSDVEMYYFHARWYNPAIGQFVSRDPLAAPRVAGGAEPESAAHPTCDSCGHTGAIPPLVSQLSWEASTSVSLATEIPASDYGFVGGNPMRFVDVDGRLFGWGPAFGLLLCILERAVGGKSLCTLICECIGYALAGIVVEVGSIGVGLCIAAAAATLLPSMGSSIAAGAVCVTVVGAITFLAAGAVLAADFLCCWSQCEDSFLEDRFGPWPPW